MNANLVRFHAASGMFEMIEPIPGVYLHPDCDQRAELCRLFPADTFPEMRAKYANLFQPPMLDSSPPE